jgi:hypothetical protein
MSRDEQGEVWPLSLGLGAGKPQHGYRNVLSGKGIVLGLANDPDGGAHQGEENSDDARSRLAITVESAA